MTVDESHTLRRSWDVCREVPVIKIEQKSTKLVKLLQWITLFIVGLLVFALAIFSKGSFLLLITLSSNTTYTVPADQKPCALLSVSVALIGPSVLLLIKCLWKIIFKDSQKPMRKTVVWVLSVEFLVAFGTAVLTIVAMPFFDIVTNAMILNSVCILSSIFQVVAQCLARQTSRFIVPPIISIVFILSGYMVFIISYLLSREDREMKIMIGLAIVGTIFVSLNWWENYSTLFRNPFLNSISEDIARSRNLVGILSSVVRILVTAAVVGAYVPLSGRDWSSVTSVPDNVRRVIWILVGIQIVSSALCHWFVVVACKMHAIRRSFLLPVYLASLGVVAAFIAPVIIFYQNLSKTNGANYTMTEYCYDITNGMGLNHNASLPERLVSDITHTLCPEDINDRTEIGFLVGSSLCWWLGWVLCTVYIWGLQLQRIERTQDLFVRRMYEGAFLEQSILLNTHFKIRMKKKVHRPDDPVTVFLCATMWHESHDEMMKMIISMFRLDKYRPKNNPNNDVSFESHIYFDDAFKDLKGSKERHINQYAEDLVEVVQQVYRIFSDDCSGIFREHPFQTSQRIIRTPYGGRLEYTLPHGNQLMVHFKDKLLIRNKKRWSQIMYLYYILGWRLNRKYFKKFVEGDDESELMEKIEKEKANTYLLALDGDTDFQPSAVMLLVDRLKRYPDVGAACGRIHPTGAGPMVWYQKFEYAVGHWLQKTAEHVFGCVLCSPGCFSLFRGAALMDDNVMKRYTTKATEAAHYIQYDQGEDRWLCTLLLQQGWRVEYNAASDAYTNAPQDFKEFYNQRRRWGPSTMANTIDLLGSGSLTSKRNRSISQPFILYQIISMAAAILGPATICIMIAGTMVKEQTIWTPSGLFIIAMVLMNLITAGLHPKEFHLVIYGLLYFICIPSGYLLLTIYSMVNMNNVSWGTRETGGPAAPKPPTQTITQRILQAKCCKCPCWDCGKLADQNGQVTETVIMDEKSQDYPDLTSQEHHRNVEFHLFQKIEQNWVTHLQNKFHDFHLNEECLATEEEDFWRELQQVYLEPLAEYKEKEKIIANELKELRNKVTFVYFICNAMWLVATFTLQLIGSSVTIKIPKYDLNLNPTGQFLYIDPIGLMFLIGFTSLLLIQFIGMFYHRIYTLIHFVAFLSMKSSTSTIPSDDDMQIPDTLETELNNCMYLDKSLTIQNPAIIQRHKSETLV
ncbi:chitin synthase chs-2-like isoform X2 [Esox lucius]|uniref:chitin synthase chs-2-like isoform X2 n=1 Tax=Esox lucius TaxID=8010 RepID=UPI0014776117|nr:chitin synthase chs-2-like isoform X2 [Esox lucius]